MLVGKGVLTCDGSTGGRVEESSQLRANEECMRIERDMSDCYEEQIEERRYIQV